MSSHLLKEKGNWDLFHIHYLYSNAYVAGLLKLPYIVHLHGSDVRLIFDGGIYNGVLHKALKRFACKRALTMLASTPNLLSLIRRLVPEVKSIYLPNPIDFKVFSRVNASKLSSCFSYLHDGIDVLITMPVKMDFKAKGNDVVLKVLSKVDFGSNSYRIATIAYGTDLPKFVELARKLGLKKRVVILKPIFHNHMPGLYGVSDVVIGAVTPREVFGMVALEAMACGSPTVNTWSKKYYGETGFPTIPYHEEKLGHFLQNLINDVELRNKVAWKQLQWVKRNHHSRKVVGKLMKIYESIL